MYRFCLSDVVRTVLEPYQIISKAKRINLKIDFIKPAVIHLPRIIIEKSSPIFC